MEAITCCLITIRFLRARLNTPQQIRRLFWRRVRHLLVEAPSVGDSAPQHHFMRRARRIARGK